jgi:hypothetical protein
MISQIDIREIVTVGMVLFAVIDILGSIPIIVDLRSKVGHIQSEKASIVAMIIMILFLFIGEELLNIIGIDVNSFAVAGAFVLFFLALEMILGIRLYKEEESETASIPYHQYNYCHFTQYDFSLSCFKIIFKNRKNAWVFRTRNHSQGFWSYITCNSC